MRRVILAGILAVLVLVLAVALWPKPEAITYYVQLVRGCDAETPPAANSKRVGPILIEKFRGPLKWKEYWEIDRREIQVAPGHATKVRLGQNCEVKIDLSDKQHRKVTAFQDGKFISRTCIPRQAAITVIGGDRDQQSSWFIVVRRDPPSLASN